MQNLVKRLEKRGWTQKEIERTVEIIHNAKETRTANEKFLERRVYWILLIIIIAANFAISVALIPLLIALRGFLLYFIIAILGIVFGLLFELVIRSIEHLERRHHIILAFVIPITALANAFIISNISNEMIRNFNLNNFHQPVIVGILYAASFAVPYLIYRFVLKMEYYSKE